MQFPESWLREFCNPDLTAQAIADVLTMAGFEVEELEPAAPLFTHVVVGEITSCEPHPNADRLRVCQVDIGAAFANQPAQDTVERGNVGLLNIVCGAPNARKGLRVPVALVGAQLLPDAKGKPFVIKQGKLRGVPSQGMLCSANELGIDDDASGLLELPLDAPLGQDIRKYLDLDELLFTLKLTPNLGHGLSIYGIARELSAITGAPLNTPKIPVVAATMDKILPVKVQAIDLCGRFSGRFIQGVNTQVQTPRWMIDRLARCGQRSVSPLVDISNYVMFEYGQPTHIFDADAITGDIQVRWAKSGETLKLLNGNTVTLDAQVGVIADAKAVESLAGIMGGEATAVHNATTNIYVEAAFWYPDAIAGRSRRFNFATDAGHRFERGVNPVLTAEYIERITQLIVDICGTDNTRVGQIDDQLVNMPQRAPVTVRVARVAKVLGMSVTEAQCLDVFRRLQFPATSDGAGAQATISVQPPAYRFDLSIEEDLIEEIIRIIGFNQLPNTPTIAPILPKARSERTRERFAIRRNLAALGYSETINFSFVPEVWEQETTANDHPIRLQNPIASEMNVMRSSLLASLLAILKRNLDRKASRVRIFEIGRVFLRDAHIKTSTSNVAGVQQPMRVAALAYGSAVPLQWSGVEKFVDFYDVKADIEALLATQTPSFEAAEHPAMHPGRCAHVLLRGQVVGFIGELHPRLRQSWELGKAPILFELDLSAIQQRGLPAYTAVSKYQPVVRDITVIVKETIAHDVLLDAVQQTNTQNLLQDVVVFDIFKADVKTKQAIDWLQPDEKSVSLRLSFQSKNASLSDAEIETARTAVLEKLKQKVQARLRA